MDDDKLELGKNLQSSGSARPTKAGFSSPGETTASLLGNKTAFTQSGSKAESSQFLPDSSRVFDDKPLKDAGRSVSADYTQYRAPQSVAPKEESPKDIWDVGSTEQKNSNPGLKKNSFEAQNQRTASDENSDGSSNVSDQNFSYYYRQSQNEQATNQSMVENQAQTPDGVNQVSEIDLAPKTEQTYEQVSASAEVANKNLQIIAKTKNKTKLKAIIFVVITLLLLTAGLVALYFYIKLTSTPQYKLNQALGSLSKQKSDISLNYQLKEGQVYEDIFTLSEKSDAGDNQQNDVQFKIGNSKLDLNLVGESGKNYLKINGLQNASVEAEGASSSLTATIKSAGTVVDEQWIELDGGSNITMPSSMLKSLYPLLSTIDKNSIKEISKDAQSTSYSLNIGAKKVEELLKAKYNSQFSNYLNQYDIKIGDYLSTEQISKLKFKVQVSNKTKTATKIIISSFNEEKIFNISFSPHQNSELIKPSQSKKMSEIINELEAATSQSGINIGPLLKP